MINRNLNENAKNINNNSNKDDLSINSHLVDLKKPTLNFNYDENKKKLNIDDDEYETQFSKPSKQSTNKPNSNGNDNNEYDGQIGSKYKPTRMSEDNTKNYYLEDNKKTKLNDEYLLNDNIDINYQLNQKLKTTNNHLNSQNDNKNYFNQNEFLDDNDEYNLNYLKEDRGERINTNSNNRTNNISTDESLSMSSSISNEENLSDEEYCANENDDEFQAILKRINFDNINANIPKEANTNLNNNNNNSNDPSIKANPSIATLKYLYKLLKFYKLEHYMNDLIDYGYYTPISLNKLKQNDLDDLNISPYDKKKFIKLQLFVKQVMSTINKANTKNNTNKTKANIIDENMFYQSQAFSNLDNNNNQNFFENLHELDNKNRPSSTSKANMIRKTYPAPSAPPKLYNSSASSLSKPKTLADKRGKEDVNNNIETNKNQNYLDYEDEDFGVVFVNKSSARTTQNHRANHHLYSSSSVSVNRPTWNEVKAKEHQAKPLFSKNPNLAQAKPKQQQRTVRISTSSNVNSKPATTSTSRQVNNSNNINKSKPIVQSRAKSTDQVGNKQSSNLTSKSITVIDPNSVCHPASFKKVNKASENFFGPKLNSQYEIQNVEFVDRQNYNYGVPVAQSDAHKNKGYIHSNHKKLRSQSHHQFNSDAQPKSNITTADIFVYARKRPKLACEAQFNDAIVIENSESGNNYETNSVCVNEVKSLVDGTPILRKNEFTFDRAFDSTFANEDIFQTSIKPFIELPYENRNDFTCICFGQTGSGKTHTLFGTKSEDGVCVLTAQTLFANNERLFCGFYEIYNGQLYDLINQNNRLVLREDSSGQLNVVGLVEVEIKSLSQLRKTIETAQSNRHIGCTSFNKASSRSHAIIQFKVPNVSSNQSNSGHVILKNHNAVKSKVNSGLNNAPAAPKAFRVLFIDLAGSERGIDAQNNQNDNRKEGAEINQSLLALKECIRCMDQYYTHAPFRQSKLTRVLRDCFIGIGRTILIATVSPTEDCVSCSLNTLQYANRVRLMTLRNRKKNEKLYKNVLGQGVGFKSMSSMVKSATNINIPQTAQNQATTNLNKITSSSSTAMTSTIRVKTTGNKPNYLEENLNQRLDDPSPPTYSSSAQKDSTNHNDNKKDAFSSKPLNTNEQKSKPLVKNAPTPTSNTNNILPSKPYNKYQPPSATAVVNQAKNVPSLFHPSKINMSSTPIKTNVNNEPASKTEDFVFENDTPIKGHKIKYISNGCSAITQLAERYFTRTESNKEVELKPDSNSKKLQFQAPTVNYYEQNEQELNGKVYCKVTPKANDEEKYTDSRKRFDLMNQNENFRLEHEFSRDRYRINRHRTEEKEPSVDAEELNKNDLFLKSRNADLLKSASTSKDLISNLRYKASLMTNLIKTNTLSARTNEWDHKTDSNTFYSALATSRSTAQIANNSKTAISDKYMSRYRSIYSLESPPPLPCHRLPETELDIKPSAYSNPYEMKYFNSDLSKNSSNALKDFKSKNYDDILANHSSLLKNRDKNEQQNNVSLIEESLNRLRKKQRELLELKRSNNNKYLNNTSMDNSNFLLSSKLNEDARSDATSFIFREDEDIDQLIENSNLFINQLKINNNDSIELIKRDNNSQKQLKVYIDALEAKLNNLKIEMKEPISILGDNGNKKGQDKANRERSLSSGSCDSLKEANGFSQFSNRPVYNEFLQRRRQLEKDHLEQQQKSEHSSDQGYVPRKNSLFSILSDLKAKKFDDDYEKLFIETQIQKQETFKSNGLDKLNESLNKKKQEFEDSSDENNSDTDALKKSFHKGNSTDLLFSKAKRSSLTKADLPTLNETSKDELSYKNSNEPKLCGFSPIENEKKENSTEDKYKKNENATDGDAQLTPRTQYQLVNPIPIRISSSSSFDSSISKSNLPKAQQNQNEDFDTQNSSRSLMSSTDGNGLLANLKNSSSKIWKATSSTSALTNDQQNEPINRNTWSNILKEARKEDGALNSHTNNNNSLLSDCSSSNSNLKTKDLLTAHEHQLSDIAEACKKEMNLLSCLKDNQVNFDDYLNQVEEMLSKKVHSIRDLQNQISQLKTCHNQTAISVNPSSQEIN